MDSLIGPLPDAEAEYHARSPLFHVDVLRTPIIFFQGTEDKIVPPNQAELMHSKVKDKGLPTALVMFEGEQHGFRQAANIRAALDGEHCFYAKVFGLDVPMPEEVQKLITIDNLA